MKADTLRAHLQEIYDKHGLLTPDLVVREARNKQHPLHVAVFDRAPKEAAEAWYRHRAHELIQSARVVFRDEDESEPLRVRAFHCVRIESGHVYEPAEKVAQDPFLRSLVLRDMEREWKQLQRRYGDFEEFVVMVQKDLGQAA